jgi:Tfp pilus assembly protein PilF
VEEIQDGRQSSYARALAEQKSRADEYNRDGERLFAAGDIQSALARFGEAIKSCPREAIYYNNLAVALHAAGQSEAAWNYALEALHRDCSLDAARENLSNIGAHIDRREEAAEILELFPGIKAGS